MATTPVLRGIWSDSSTACGPCPVLKRSASSQTVADVGGRRRNSCSSKARTRVSTDWRSVSADYFRALNVPLLAGRTFNESDTPDHTAVGVIRRTARKGRLRRYSLFNASPLSVAGGDGLRLLASSDMFAKSVTAIHGRRSDWPHQQRTQDRMANVSTTADLSSLSAPMTTAIDEVDPDQPLYDVRPMPAVLERTLRGQWINMVLISVFAALARVIASVGLYGVVWSLTAQRRRELPFGLAVGATASDVLALVLEAGPRLAVGLALGLMLSAVSTRALGTMLHGVTAWDTWTSFWCPA